MPIAANAPEGMAVRPNTLADNSSPIAASATTTIAGTVEPYMQSDDGGRGLRSEASSDAFDRGPSRCTFPRCARPGSKRLKLSDALNGNGIRRNHFRWSLSIRTARVLAKLTGDDYKGAAADTAT
jgi:hypothetical protein